MINLLISLSQLRVSTRSKKRDKKKRKVKKLTLDQRLYRGILLQPMGKENLEWGMRKRERGLLEVICQMQIYFKQLCFLILSYCKFTVVHH